MRQPTMRKQGSDDDDHRSIQSDKDEKVKSLEEGEEEAKAPKNEHDLSSAQAPEPSDLQPRQEDMELAAKIVIAADEGASEEQYKIEPSGEERERAASPSGAGDHELSTSMPATLQEEAVSGGGSQQGMELDAAEPVTDAGDEAADEGRRPDEPPTSARSDRAGEPRGSQTQQHQHRVQPRATVPGAVRVLGINGNGDDDTVTTREESVAALSAQLVDTDRENQMLRDYERLRRMEANAALAQVIEEEEPDNAPNGDEDDDGYFPGGFVRDTRQRRVLFISSILLLLVALVLGLVFGVSRSQPVSSTVPEPTASPMSSSQPETFTPVAVTPRPTKEPTISPRPSTLSPTVAPTVTPRPTESPTTTKAPSSSPTLSQRPTSSPTIAPTITPRPTKSPTSSPMPTMTPQPTTEPTFGDEIVAARVFNQRFQITDNREFNEAESAAFCGTMENYTDDFGGRDDERVTVECQIRSQTLQVIGGSGRVLTERPNGGGFESVRSQTHRRLQVVFNQVEYEMTYMSKHTNVTFYPTLFQNFVNSDLDAVTADLQNSGLAVENSFLAFNNEATLAPTTAPSISSRRVLTSPQVLTMAAGNPVRAEMPLMDPATLLRPTSNASPAANVAASVILALAVLLSALFLYYRCRKRENGAERSGLARGSG